MFLTSSGPSISPLPIRALAVCGLVLMVTAVSVLAGSPGSLQSITEREIQRRQKLVADAQTQLDEAVLIDSKGEHAKAAAQLMTVYQALPDAPSAAELKKRVRAAYANAACAEAKSLLNQAKYAEAQEMLDSVLAEDVDPKNELALKLRKQSADPDRYPPALTPTHIANVEKVQRLLVEAGSLVDLGDYPKAATTYAAVLRIDPHNVAARRGLETVEQHRSVYLDGARDQARAKAMTDVTKAWEDGVPPSSDLSNLFSGAGGGAMVARGGREKLEAKLRNTRIPKAEFNGATLEEVIEYLRVSSRSNDPDGTGVGFVVNVEPETANRQMTLSLVDVPLEELVRYVTEMSGTSYRVEENAVLIASLSQKSTALIQKVYRVPPDFIQKSEVAPAAGAADPFAPAAAAQTAALQRMGAKEFLQSRGVVFPEGGGASFSPMNSTLIVRTNAEGLTLVDMLVDSAKETAPKQAKITVKVIEISQNNLDETGFDTLLGQFNLPGSERVFAGGGTVGNQGDPTNFPPLANGTIMSGGLRSSGTLLGLGAIDSEIANSKVLGGSPSLDSRSPTQFALNGIFTDPQFQVMIRAIDQKKGMDIVSLPSIVTKSGQKASVRSVREFPYPTEFDPPQIPQAVGQSNAFATNLLTGTTTTNANNSGPVTPATPTAFEVKELGMVLEVEPNISADGRTVEISIAPSMTEFEGFIDYGSDITNSIDSTTFNALLFAYVNTPGPLFTVENNILQPVFRKSALGSPVVVNVYDGSTIAIGGVVTERLGDVQDKVPVLGDIPLIGRFWQSKVKQTQKKAVMFFVTVEVLDPAGQRIQHATAAAQ